VGKPDKKRSTGRLTHEGRDKKVLTTVGCDEKRRFDVTLDISHGRPLDFKSTRLNHQAILSGSYFF